MPEKTANGLEPKSSAILWMLAGGFSIENLIDGHSEISREDVARAAQQALEIADRGSGPDRASYVDVIRKSHPHAYAPWTAEQDAELIRLHGEGKSQAQIAEELGRRPNAIAKRIEKHKSEGRIDAPGSGTG